MPTLDEKGRVIIDPGMGRVTGPTTGMGNTTINRIVRGVYWKHLI